jgi:hypothetical protein
VQHRVVDFTTKRILDGVRISAMTVRRQLHAIDKPRFQIVHEMIGATGVPLAYKPTRDESEPWIPKGEQFGLPTRIGATDVGGRQRIAGNFVLDASPRN